jgi:hypothetical protein
MRTGPENEIEMEGCGDPSQELEPNTFGETVLDHGQRPLTYAGGFTQPRLRLELHQSHRAQVRAEVEDHRFDSGRLGTKVVRHERIGAWDAYPVITGQ